MGKHEQPGDRPAEIGILFENDHLIAVVKPAGLPTANVAAGRESLFTWLKERFGPGGFAGIVSRLDAPVSGVVVAAKSPAAAANLAEQFRTRQVRKTYVAVVTGRFPAALGQWVEWSDRIVRGQGPRPSRILPRSSAAPEAGDTGAGRAAPGSVGRDSGPVAESQGAETRGRVVRRAGEVSLVELEPLTGRRHQLRVQLAARGCPIVGDRAYGSRLPFPLAGGIALHAASLVVRDPGSGRERTFTAAPPPVWRRAFSSLFDAGTERP